MEGSSDLCPSVRSYFDGADECQCGHITHTHTHIHTYTHTHACHLSSSSVIPVYTPDTSSPVHSEQYHTHTHTHTQKHTHTETHRLTFPPLPLTYFYLRLLHSCLSVVQASPSRPPPSLPPSPALAVSRSCKLWAALSTVGLQNEAFPRGRHGRQLNW